MMLLITGKENGKTKRNRQCGKDLLWTTSSVYGTHKKEDIELFIEKANAYHPTHIKFTGEISEINSWTQQCTKRWVNGGGRGSYARICTDIKVSK